ncbi:MAG: amidohydrolase family protein [Planctomycetota bacterium]
MARKWTQLAFLATLASAAAIGSAQDDLHRPPANGPRRDDPGWHALVGATVHISPGKVVEDFKVVIRNGRITTVSPNPVQQGARIWDMTGRHIYAGLIDAYVEVDAPQPRADAGGVHWNTKVTPQRSALHGDGIDKKTVKELRELGFTAAVIAPRGGIFRGTGALVALANHPGSNKPPVYRTDVYQSIAFERFTGSNRGYPTAQMGAIAVIRQSLLDVGWLREKRQAGLHGGPSALFALATPKGRTPLLFDTADELEALRAARIGREFNRRSVLLGSGREFRRLDAIAKDKLSIILPLNYPTRPVVETLGDQDVTDLRTLMTWEQAPTNARRLDAAGIPVSLTTSKLERRKRFRKNLREAIRHGLSTDRALAMLTTNPAELLGVADRLGKVAPGMIANLTITDGPLFKKETKVRSVFIDGVHHRVDKDDKPDLRGRWALKLVAPHDAITELVMKGKDRIEAVFGKKKIVAKHVELGARRLQFTLLVNGEVLSFAATVDGDTLSGDFGKIGGEMMPWSATRTAPNEKPKEKKGPGAPNVPEEYGVPFGAFALPSAPPADKLRVVGGTVWTCGPAGIIENGEVRIEDGKIVYVGERRDENADGFTVWDATGKHVTPGIIDCHSHTGISKGINDSGQAVTAEVRIADVTNPDSISWYRQLAGGVTTVNSLHGSANPIGGQNCVNKVRWGAPHPDDMHFQEAPQGIKFALGENVKQSNWGDKFKTRYPQTRMGVETLMRDRFLAARAYAKSRKDSGPTVRRDLELDAIAEILAGTRLIHCHSYRQDEILMLCRLAGEFGFKIGTFQHVLEGYKVADAIKEHALGGSAFSDWWAYKVEVQDAIPTNGAIMHEVGVVVSFNSDSDDHARRLNVEAAKAIKYGGVPRAEALKFVTLNAAIQLGIGHLVGSLERGKHADLAIWSGDPLSAFSKCEATWVDGKNRFSLAKDQELRERAAKERIRILKKLLGGERDDEFEDEDEEDDERTRRRRRRRRGPVEAWQRLQREHEETDDARCGVCGCYEGAR